MCQERNVTQSNVVGTIGILFNRKWIIYWLRLSDLYKSKPISLVAPTRAAFPFRKTYTTKRVQQMEKRMFFIERKFVRRSALIARKRRFILWKLFSANPNVYPAPKPFPPASRYLFFTRTGLVQIFKLFKGSSEKFHSRSNQFLFRQRLRNLDQKPFRIFLYLSAGFNSPGELSVDKGILV
jgi:hypothetical protein